MEQFDIEKKTIFVVNEHHQILEAWNKIKPSNVFCLDYHTDTKKAFLCHSFYQFENDSLTDNLLIEKRNDYSNELIKQFISDKLTIKECINGLRNDEFIDFAVKAKIIKQIFIFGATINHKNSNENVSIIEDETDCKSDFNSIIQYSPNCDNADNVINDCYLQIGLKKVNELNSDFFSDFILDIDLDYFNSRKSIEPDSKSAIFQLINKAKFITVSLEKDYVEVNKIDGEDIDSDYLLCKLKNLIFCAQLHMLNAEI